MVFIVLTRLGGEQFSVNTETVKYCEGYDQEFHKADALDAARSQFPPPDEDIDPTPADHEFHGINESQHEGLRATLDRVKFGNGKIHFVDGAWMATRETPEKIAELARHALASVVAEAEAMPSPSAPPRPANPAP